MHVLKTGCRWQDCPPEYGPYTRCTIAITVGARGEFGSKSSRGWQSRPKRWRSTAPISKRTAAPAAEKGASEQAIGITRGGRNSKVHALVDKLCRPWVIILTPGNVADCTVGP